MKIDSLDHLVLTVTDIRATTRFYARTLVRILGVGVTSRVAN